MAEIEFWLRTESELNESSMCGNRFKLKNELLVHMFWCIWMSVSFSVSGFVGSVVGTLVSVVGTLVSALSHWLQ